MEVAEHTFAPDASLGIDTVEEYETARDASLAAHKVLIVQVTAEWCPRCPAFGDAIKALTSEYQFVWATNDASEAEFIEHFGIKQLPAFVLVCETEDPVVVVNANAEKLRTEVARLCTPMFTMDADF